MPISTILNAARPILYVAKTSLQIENRALRLKHNIRDEVRHCQESQTTSSSLIFHFIRHTTCNKFADLLKDMKSKERTEKLLKIVGLLSYCYVDSIFE